jgi:hypothetical protein
MPLISNLESVRRGNPSLLAVMETLLASAASFWLAWWQGSVEHIVAAGAIAPFLLLKTPLATRYQTFLVSRAMDHSDLLLWSSLMCGFLPFKVFSALRVLVRKPLEGLNSIPRNFFVNALCIDLFISPRLITGTEGLRNDSGDTIAIYDFVKNLKDKLTDNDDIDWTNIAISLPILLVISSFSFAYRFAIKSTAIFWLPLLWIVRNARVPRRPYDQIHADLQDPLKKALLVYSGCTAVAFIAKLWLLFAATNLPSLAWLGPIGTLTIQLVDPPNLPLWQIASALNAIIAWGFFFRGSRLYLTRHLADAPSETWVQREYAIIRGVRTILSVYTIFCTLYIGAVVAWHIDWPSIHILVFPWSRGRE